MNISLIIPNYNGEVLLKKNLPKVLDAVKDYKDGRVEIVIPDDGSTDGSNEEIRNFFEEIEKHGIIGKTTESKNKKGSGFSNNVNRGVKIATGEILILLNTDVAPHRDFIQPLLKHFKNPDVFAVGCLEESLENGKTVLRGRGVGSFKRGFLTHKKGDIEDTGTLWVSCGSGAFRRSIWNKLNGLDDIYNPFYWEDIDISYRAIKSGYKLKFESKSIVIHEHSLGTIKTGFSDNFIKKTAYRNQLIFVWKNITDTKYLVSHLLWLPFHLVKAILNLDFEFLSGFMSAIFLLPKITSSRKNMRKLFVLKDAEII